MEKENFEIISLMPGKMFGDTTLLLSMHTVATNPVCSDGTEVNFSSVLSNCFWHY